MDIYKALDRSVQTRSARALPGITRIILFSISILVPVAEGVADPPPRRAHVMVSTGDRILMWAGFGGSATGEEYLNDFWSYTAEFGWEPIENTHPPQGYRSAACWDSDRKVAVSFGGAIPSKLSNEIYEYAPGNIHGEWIHREVSGPRPSPRLGAAMTYIPGWGCLMTGGNQGGNETWHWNGNTWRQLSSPCPETVYVHSLIWDSKRERAIQFGGIMGFDALNCTHEFDPIAETWSEIDPAISPAPRFIHSFAYVPSMGPVIGYGRINSTEPFFQNLWRWAGTSWFRIEQDGVASPRFCAQTCWLPGHGLVLFGGENGSGIYPDGGRLGDTVLLIRDPSVEAEKAMTLLIH